MSHEPSHPVVLSKLLQVALETWCQNYVIQAPLECTFPRICLTSDAFSSGWGAHLDDAEVSYQWSLSELDYHINLKELIAVVRFCEHLYELLTTLQSQIVPVYIPTSFTATADALSRRQIQ